MGAYELDPSQESIAELRVALGLQEAMRLMALADIRAPLTDLCLSASVAERLADQHTDPKLRAMIRDIHDGANRALSLLGALGDETGPAVDLRVTDVHELVNLSLRAVEGLVRLRGLRVEVALSGDAARALCDRLRTLRALVAVLSSAARRSPPEGRLRVEGAVRGSAYHLAVLDDGEPLSPEEVEAMLSPVLVRDAAVSVRDLGRAHKSLILQGGDLAVRPRGEGMAFEVTLPMPGAR
ncbi:MAG: hypothetical protein R3A48_23010 [Polyangiales bacterium]